MHLLRLSVPLLLCAAAVLFLANPAFAIGDGTVGSFSCSGGMASGQLYVSNASCPTTLSIDNFFSFLICNMEQLSSNLMGHMFCGMISALAPLVWVAATLAIIFFAIGFMFGIVPMHGREAIMFLVKLAFFTGFATNADLLIGTGYKLLITGIRDGVTIVLQGLGGTINSGDDLYKLLDGFVSQGFHFATDGMGATEANKEATCKNAVFAVIATMTVAFPMLSYLGLVLLGRIVITFFRAMFGYVYALVSITFLMTLAPIFCTFALFKNPTIHGFFDKWVSYLVSFSLQIVLLFSFLGFVMMIDVKNLTKSVDEIIMYRAETVDTTAIRLPWQYCTLCDFEVVNSSGGGKMEGNDPNFIDEGKLQCKSPKKAISMTFGAAPDSTNTMNSLIKLAGTGIMSLIVLAILVERLLAAIPYLGQKLASGLGGGAYIPQLGGGGGAQGVAAAMPGDRLISDFNAGFERSYQRPGTSTADGLTGAYRWIKDGTSSMLTGKMSSAKLDRYGKPVLDREGKEIQEEVGNGVMNNIKDWLSDPNKIKK